MAENPKPTTDPNQLTLIILFAQIEHLTETLKAYYDQHQATACECSLWQRGGTRLPEDPA